MIGKGEERRVGSGRREEGETEENAWAQGGKAGGTRARSGQLWLPPPCSRPGLLKGRRMSLCIAAEQGNSHRQPLLVIKIFSSPVKDTYHSSSPTRSLSEKENQLNRWGLTFHSSCERVQGCPLAASKLVRGSQSTPRMAGERLWSSVSWCCVHKEDLSPAAGNTVWVAVAAAPGCSGCQG